MEELYNLAVAAIAICSLGAFTSLFTLIISILSYKVIASWRTFKNYVFLNIVFAFNAIYCLPLILIFTDFFANHKQGFFVLDIAMNFFNFAICCWLMVLAMLFYVDLVTVFGTTMTRKVLKCNLFAWGLPFVVSVGKVVNKLVIFSNENNRSLLDREDFVVAYHEYFYYEEIGQNIVLVILLAVNFGVYVRVVSSLLKRSAVRSANSGNRAQKLQVATLAFIMSGFLLMVSVLMTVLMLAGKRDKYYLYPLGLVAFGIQTSVINICFLISRANRTIWTQYIQKLVRQHKAKKQENSGDQNDNMELK